MWPALPPSLPADAAEVEAARLDLDATGGTADELRLVLDDWSWNIRRARWPAPAATCPAAYRLEGVVGRSADVETAAEAVEFCPGRSATWRSLTLEGPRFWLSAAAGTWSPGPTGARLSVEGARLTRCRCADPPWEVRADALTLTDAATAWATWPTLRLADVPVLTVPAWEFPLEARRAGLLWPELAWRGEDGPAARLPVFLPLGRSADLTPAPGYEAGAGPTGALRLRWRTDDVQAGELHVAGDERGVEAAGVGSAGLGATQLALDGRIASTERLYAAHARAPATAFAPVAMMRTGVALPGERVYAALRLPVTQDRRTDARTWMPAAAVGLGTTAGPLQLDADVEEWVQRGDGVDANRLRAGLSAAAAEWFGPVRAQLQASEATIARQAGEARSTRVYGVVAAEAGTALHRRYDAVVHRIDLTTHGAFARAGVQGDETPTGDPLDAARDVNAAWLTLSTQLTGRDLDAMLSASWGDDAGLESDAWPWATAHFAAPWVRVDAAYAAGDAVHGLASAGPDAFAVRLGYARFGAAGATPLARSTTPGAVQRVLGDDGVSETLVPGVGTLLGPLTASWDLVLGRRPDRFVGHAGDVRWAGRCQCWHAGLHVEQSHPAPWPDAYFTVSLD